jgi:Ni/Co efflux regulator RcnB
MRKLLISLLLASAAASPALADRPDHSDRDAARAERQAAHDSARAERSDRPVQVQRPQLTGQPHFERTNGGGQPQVQAVQRGGDQRGSWDRSRFEGHGNVAPQVVQQQQQQRSYRGYRGDLAGQPQQVDRTQRGVGWSRDRGSWSRDRDGDFRQRNANQQQQLRDRSRWASGGWNRDWRNDRRYDWRNYRNRHRSIFSIGIYYDPFGYGYQPFDIGYRLQPSYYGQRYWIDPAMYSLPYPPPGTEWVRYWNDALLVDTYSGEVVDVIHNFFW